MQLDSGLGPLTSPELEIWSVPDLLDVREVTLTPGSDRDRRSGLLGYLSLHVGDLALDGLTLRRRMNGDLSLSYPARTDGRGVRHPLVQPVDRAARARLETAVFAALGIDQPVDPGGRP